MKYKRLIMWFAVIGLFVTISVGALAQSDNTYKITWSTVSSGSVASAGSSYTLAGTIGQPVVGTTSGNGYTLTSGFWGSSATRPSYRRYVPLAMTGPAPAPDLIGSLQISPDKQQFKAGEPVQVTVTITNTGTAAAGPFYADLFINPSTPPTAANSIWNNVCGLNPCFGLTWVISESLEPGQSITRTSAIGSYATSYSNWRGWFANGTTDLYLYVDSWNPGVSSGAVQESNEFNNRAELHGLRVTGSNPMQVQATQVESLPLRPVLGSK